MGNDGSSISRVKSLQIAVNSSSKKLQNSDSRNFDSDSKWAVDRLTSLPLRLPLVSDYQGNLLNKESVLEWLLTPDKEDYTEEQVRLFGHIKTLKDVVELHNIIFDQPKHRSPSLRCDVGDEILGKSSGKLAYLAQCGHVLPRRMLGFECPVCGIAHSATDIITLNPSYDELSILQARMDELEHKGLTHSGRTAKSKKRRSKQRECGKNSKRRAA
ncbi:LANO_0B08284g1_1 [Lachancea nothofagi CBS 11611]|uniref:LANO_0B08284g1_1 n=1 Tax=Lachancea nothofagi CBS 11611 TaxID=1266666 RepID=A0A1G4J0J5_9SACH|nr:LANO_0B08284g1_1 [Lachancea nothofagi CBS 11611]